MVVEKVIPNNIELINLFGINDNNLKYTSEKNNSKYDVIIGPLENTEANNLVSYFISKGYKETEILIE